MFFPNLFDHAPVLLNIASNNWGPSPFRFELMWLQEPGFPDLVRRWWKENDCDGWMGFCLAQKLKFLKHEMRDGIKLNFKG